MVHSSEENLRIYNQEVGSLTHLIIAEYLSSLVGREAPNQN